MTRRKKEKKKKKKNGKEAFDQSASFALVELCACVCFVRVSWLQRSHLVDFSHFFGCA
jgi:hypothetical protein